MHEAFQAQVLPAAACEVTVPAWAASIATCTCIMWPSLSLVSHGRRVAPQLLLLLLEAAHQPLPPQARTRSPDTASLLAQGKAMAAASLHLLAAMVLLPLRRCHHPSVAAAAAERVVAVLRLLASTQHLLSEKLRSARAHQLHRIYGLPRCTSRRGKLRPAAPALVLQERVSLQVQLLGRRQGVRASLQARRLQVPGLDLHQGVRALRGRVSQQACSSSSAPSALARVEPALHQALALGLVARLQQAARASLLALEARLHRLEALALQRPSRSMAGKAHH